MSSVVTWKALMVVALASACQPIQITVAAAGSDVDGGPGASCMTATCQGPAFCKKTSCGDLTGICELLPGEQCPSTYDPVCGCDGVIYWNDCLRQQNGISAMSPGSCTGSSAYTLCHVANPVECPTGAFCTTVPGGPHACDHDALGTCWVLGEPPDDAGPPDWRVCGGPPTCTDFYSAIVAGRAYHDGPMCH